MIIIFRSHNADYIFATQAMTAHGHSLGLSMGWYTNNFQNSNCESGWSKTPELSLRRGAEIATTWSRLKISYD